MLKVKRKLSMKKRRLNSASSSTVGSVSDLEDRVVMLCEDVPNENSFDSGRGSNSAGARSSRGSQCDEHESGSEQRYIHLSRDRHSYRQACYVEREPTRAQTQYYIQRVVQVYEYLFNLMLSLCPAVSFSQVFVGIRSAFYPWMLCACAYMLLDRTYPPGRVLSEGVCLSPLSIKWYGNFNLLWQWGLLYFLALSGVRTNTRLNPLPAAKRELCKYFVAGGHRYVINASRVKKKNVQKRQKKKVRMKISFLSWLTVTAV